MSDKPTKSIQPVVPKPGQRNSPNRTAPVPHGTSAPSVKPKK